jgi:hypothetical protein
VARAKKPQVVFLNFIKCKRKKNPKKTSTSYKCVKRDKKEMDNKNGL